MTLEIPPKRLGQFLRLKVGPARPAYLSYGPANIHTSYCMRACIVCLSVCVYVCMYVHINVYVRMYVCTYVCKYYSVGYIHNYQIVYIHNYVVVYIAYSIQ